MKHEIIQLITSFLGSLGFAIIFNLQKKHLLVASIGGALCWASYLLTGSFASGVFIPTLVASAVAAFRTFARKQDF